MFIFETLNYLYEIRRLGLPVVVNDRDGDIMLKRKYVKSSYNVVVIKIRISVVSSQFASEHFIASSIDSTLSQNIIAM